MRPSARHPRIRTLLSALLALGLVLAPVKPALTAMLGGDCCPSEAAGEAAATADSGHHAEAAPPCHGEATQADASTSPPQSGDGHESCSSDCLLACAAGAPGLLQVEMHVAASRGDSEATAPGPSRASVPAGRLLRPPITA